MLIQYLRACGNHKIFLGRKSDGGLSIYSNFRTMFAIELGIVTLLHLIVVELIWIQLFKHIIFSFLSL